MTDRPERTRKGNRESTISETPNASGYYEAKVWMGTKPDGKPDRRHVQRKNLAAVRRRVRELEGRRDSGKAGKAGKLPTVQEMLERHMTVVLTQRGRAPKTIASYRSLAGNEIYPRWGGCRIDRLTPEWIEDGYAEMIERGLSAATVMKVHRLLSSAYRLQAQRSQAFGLAGGTVLINPCDYVEPSGVPEADKKSLTRREARAVLAEAEQRGNWLRWAYGLACGNRQGEALGLRWSFLDIDVPEGEPGEARIAWQLQRLTWEHGCSDAAEKELRRKGTPAADIARAVAAARHACGEQHHRLRCPVPCPRAARQGGRKHVCPEDDGTTRSASGTRGKLCPDGCTGHARHCPLRKLPQGCVPVSGALVLREIKEKRRRRVKAVAVPPELCGPLREHRAKQFEVKMLAADEWRDLDLVFCRWDGTPADPRRDYQEWTDLLAAAGVAHRGTHSGRHTTASVAVDEGVALTVVKEMLGHSDIRVTEGYVQTASTQAHRAARTIGRALFGDGEQGR